MDLIAANQSIEDLIGQWLFPEDQLHEGNSTGTRACDCAKDPEEHECGSSEMSDTLISELTHHQGTHHPEEPFPLDETDRVETAVRNWKSQSGRITFICEVCGKVFLSRLGLKKHTSKIHFKIGPYGCEVCKKKFFTKYDLDAHMRVHKGMVPYEQNGKEYECPFCEKPHTTMQSLSLHQRRHHPEEAFLLDEIDLVETAIGNWKKRELRATFTCEVCKKVFLSRIGLANHTSKFHFKMGPYGCEVCKKKFFTKYDLEAHMIFHRGMLSNEQCKGEYECHFCEKSYTRKLYLKHHQRKHHPEETLLLDETDEVETAEGNANNQGKRLAFTCEVCNRVYPSRLGLRIHMFRTHSVIKSYGCEMCTKKFFTNYDLDTHLNVHKFECKICQKMFYKKHYLTVHMRVHIYECEICRKQFDKTCDLDSHMCVHMGTES